MSKVACLHEVPHKPIPTKAVPHNCLHSLGDLKRNDYLVFTLYIFVRASDDIASNDSLTFVVELEVGGIGSEGFGRERNT